MTDPDQSQQLKEMVDELQSDIDKDNLDNSVKIQALIASQGVGSAVCQVQYSGRLQKGVVVPEEEFDNFTRLVIKSIS